MVESHPNWVLAGLMLIFMVQTLFDYVRERSLLRFDIALWGVGAGLGLALWALQLDGLVWLYLPLQFTHSYQLARLTRHVRPVPLLVQAIAVAASVSAWVLFPTAVGLLPQVAPALLVVLRLLLHAGSALVDLWAAAVFAGAAVQTRGVSRWRLGITSVGCSLLMLASATGASGNAYLYTLLLPLSAVLFYISFATPAWLRRIWQLAEMHQFLRAGSGRTVQERAEQNLDRLCPSAARAVGGVAAAVALWDPATAQMSLRPSKEFPALTGDLEAQAGAIASAWYQRQPFLAQSPAQLGAEGIRLTTLVSARFMMVVPIITDEQAFGLLLVFLRTGSLFPADDLALLALLTEQSAIALANAALFRSQQELTEQLKQTNADLERANRTKSEFLANMSHELRTPLNAIIGFSEVLLDEDMPIDEETEGQFQENILGSGRHLLNLINDILDLTKVETGKLELTPEEFALGEALQGVHAVIKPLAQKKHQQLTLLVEPDLPVVHHDPGRVKQVMYNLLSNAVKFTPESGQITSTVRLSGQGWLEVSVTDTGIGIKPEDQQAIFEEFRQVDSGYARQQQGTGLGLALVRRFVRLMGGDITVSSVPGEGSTFTVSLPVRQGTPTAAPRAAGEGPLVLVVEDDAASASLLSFHLTRGGYRVERAGSAVVALEKAQRLRPAVITLDIVLPQEDGWHVLRELKANPVTQQIPVVVVSIVDDPSTAQAAGASDHLVKPVDPTLLLSTVRHLTPSV